MNLGERCAVWMPDALNNLYLHLPFVMDIGRSSFTTIERVIMDVPEKRSRTFNRVVIVLSFHHHHHTTPRFTAHARYHHHGLVTGLIFCISNILHHFFFRASLCNVATNSESLSTSYFNGSYGLAWTQTTIPSPASARFHRAARQISEPFDHQNVDLWVSLA